MTDKFHESVEPEYIGVVVNLGLKTSAWAVVEVSELKHGSEECRWNGMEEESFVQSCMQCVLGMTE